MTTSCVIHTCIHLKEYCSDLLKRIRHTRILNELKFYRKKNVLLLNTNRKSIKNELQN